MTRYKISLPPPVGEYEVEYVVNPDGVVWGIRADDPHADFPEKPGGQHKTVVEVAEARQNGWRLATEDEIREHCAKSGDWLPPELEKSRRGARADKPEGKTNGQSEPAPAEKTGAAKE